jgi:hypothetical protein
VTWHLHTKVTALAACTQHAVQCKFKLDGLPLLQWHSTQAPASAYGTYRAAPFISILSNLQGAQAASGKLMKDLVSPK